MAKWLQPSKEIDFVATRKIASIFSGISVFLSLVLFFVVEPTWGIDFTGGTEMHIKFQEETSIAQLRDALQAQGLSGDSVQQINSPTENEFMIRIQDPEFGTQEIQASITKGLQTAFGSDWIQESSFDTQIGSRLVVTYTGDPKTVQDIQTALENQNIVGTSVELANDDNKVYIKIPSLSSTLEEKLRTQFPATQPHTDAQGQDVPNMSVLQVDSVGPKVGGELREQGVLAILATLFFILIYVAFRFNLAFAPGAVIALFHDVTVVVGVFIVLKMFGIVYEFNLPMIGALLTIIGYSLNDTIVIYDRLRENMTRYRRKEMETMINVSINETLGRTLATSLTTIVAMLAFLTLGGPVIQTFALAIILGVVFGTYSTIYIATPTILLMQEIQPWLLKVFSPASTGTENPSDSSDTQQS